jgi:hypothetical protein
MGVCADAWQHGDEPPGDVGHANGQHHNGKRRLPKNRPNECPLHQQAEQRHASHGGQHRQPKGETQHRHAHQAPKGAKHHELALGEAHRLGGLVDEDEAQSDQPIDTTQGDAADDQLHELHESSLQGKPGL